MLTLRELAFAIEDEDTMYRINNILPEERKEARIVTFRKNEVVIDGESRVMLQVRDVTDSVLFQKECNRQQQETAEILIVENTLQELYEKHISDLHTLISNCNMDRNSEQSLQRSLLRTTTSFHSTFE